MALLTLNDITLHYRMDGVRDRPALVLINSLGTSLEMWDAQCTALAESFFIIRYDARGHGQSSITAGPCTIAQMGMDLLALLDALDLPLAHVCGLSLGGMVGQWLGIHAPQRVHRLVLSNTAAQIGTLAGWNARIHQVEAEGMAAIEPAVISRWFTEDFRAAQPAQVERIAAMLRKSPVPGYTAACAAIRDMDQRAEVARITARTLVIAGTQDQVTTVKDANFLTDTMQHARLLTLHAAHLANIEAADAFTQATLDFLLEGDTNGR